MERNARHRDRDVFEARAAQSTDRMADPSLPPRCQPRNDAYLTKQQVSMAAKRRSLVYLPFLDSLQCPRPLPSCSLYHYSGHTTEPGK